MKTAQYLLTKYFVQGITNVTVLPFALATLCFYIYNFLCHDFRSLKFGLLLLLILFVCVTQVTALFSDDVSFSYRHFYFHNM